MAIPALAAGLAAQACACKLTRQGWGTHPLKDAGCFGHIADEGDDGHSVRAGDLGKVPKRGRERLNLLLNQVALPDLAAPESWPQAMPHSPPLPESKEKTAESIGSSKLAPGHPAGVHLLIHSTAR